MEIQSKVFSYHEEQGVGFLTFDRLSELPMIRHAFSTKIGEGSRTEKCMNLSFNNEDAEAVTDNYRRFCAAAGFAFDSLTASAQDHHTYVRVCTQEQKGIGIYREKDMLSVDALVTNTEGLTLVTYYADCTPLYFVDVNRRAIGLAHGGWRGTVGRIAQKVVDTMRREYGTDPKDLVCAIGPNIAVCCYEVDEACAAHFRALGLDSSRFVFPKEGGKFMVDMLECNRQLLTESGVLPENIVVSDICTSCRSDLLWSHRATKGNRGTMAAFLRLNPQK